MVIANASASVRGGFLGLWGRQPILHLGTPLIAGMNTQQLAGVIAHELGHFSQRGGLFLYNFINQFSDWCQAAVAMQDELADGVADGDNDNSVIESLFRLVIWTTQSLGSLIIRCLAIAGLLVTRFATRRLEFDADRYEAEVAGSDAFFGTTRRMIELSLGRQAILRRGLSTAVAVLSQADGLESLTSEIVAAADLAAENSVRHVEAALQEPTGWFDTHPGTRDRIAAVRANPQQGLFRLKLPAYLLYPRFNPNPT